MGAPCKGVGVLVGLAVLLRLIGSSSSPSEKNWPLLEVAVAWDPRLRRSEELAPFSTKSLNSPEVRVGRLSCEACEVRDSREPEPSLLKAEYVETAS